MYAIAGYFPVESRKQAAAATYLPMSTTGRMPRACNREGASVLCPFSIILGTQRIVGAPDVATYVKRRTPHGPSVKRATVDYEARTFMGDWDSGKIPNTHDGLADALGVEL